MRSTLASLAVLALIACGKSKDDAAAAADSAAAAAAAAMPAPITLADVAGKWSVKTMAMGSDSALVTTEINAGADASSWTITFPGRPPIAVRVLEVAGDSITTEAGPYESALRKGVQVTTHSVMRLVDGKLIGATTARYNVATADSVLLLHTEGTRVQ